MAIKIIKSNNISWYYIIDFSNQDLAFLKENFKFHPLDLKDCAGEAQRSKIDIYKNYLFLVLQLPDFEPNQNKLTINQFYIFMGKDYLITVTREKMKFLNSLFYKTINNKKFKDYIFSQGSGYLLYRILDYVLHQRWKTLSYLDQKIQKIETEIDEGRGKREVFEIAALRRLILEFKSILDPQHLTINTLSRLNVTFLTKEILVYFDDIDDYVEKVWLSLESYRERTLSLHEINESLISYRTNKIMTILMMFSVALLPLTFLAGVYGMNINLPFADSPERIWTMFGILALIIIGIFLILKQKDWI